MCSKGTAETPDQMTQRPDTTQPDFLIEGQFWPLQHRSNNWFTKTKQKQVWPLTHFFLLQNHCFAFCRETLFSSVPPSNSLVSVSDPWGAFWADTASFKGHRLALCVPSITTEIRGHCQVCHARWSSPRTPSTTTVANLDCAFVENALFYTNPWLWKFNRIKLS